MIVMLANKDREHNDLVIVENAKMTQWQGTGERKVIFCQKIH